MKNIDADDYAYGNYNKKIGWRLSANQDNPPNKSQLLFKEKWVLKNMNIKISNKDNDIDKIKNINVDNNDKNKNEITGTNTTKLLNIPKAPELLILNDNEKFKDGEIKQQLICIIQFEQHLSSDQ